ncbi:MAG: polyhydroxyalkanoate synthesis regulator DNA-binding domain-containing protein, partial [Planctomycetota bacterium]
MPSAKPPSKDEALLIKRYPNRRLYARHASKYIALEDVERLIRDGYTVQIRDNESGEDITRTVLTQIIVERHPDKVSLFPTDMLHLMLRANDVMSDFLRGYFRDSLTYLEYLQRHGAQADATQPMHWLKAWLEQIGAGKGDRPQHATADASKESSAEPAPTETADPDQDAASLALQLRELEARLRRLESENQPAATPGSPGRTAMPATNPPTSNASTPALGPSNVTTEMAASKRF